jgi:flagellar hook-associated protein 3 FlgL
MRTTWVSSYSLFNGPRADFTRLQAEAGRLSTELATGRHADLGLKVGILASRSIELRSSTASLTAMIDGNAAVVARLNQTDATLARIAGDADRFLQSALAATDSTTTYAVLGQEAASNLDAFVEALNVSDGRRYLFGGINSAVRPVNDPSTGAAAAIATAFEAKFGLPPGDAASAGIAPADMADFLDAQVADLVDGSGWSVWSNASDTPIATRIAANETIDGSVSANEPSLRRLAAAYALFGGVGVEALNSETRRIVVDRTRSAMAEGVTDLIALRAAVGTGVQRSEAASERMMRERDVVELRTSALESVDPYEAKVRFDQISTQIQMSYSLTNRLLGLSILNYA